MISSYQSYMFYTKDLSASLDRVGKDPTVAREAAYYRQTIGTIKTVDEFMADDRVYAYAMKAYGLEDMAYAKAFIRKVLESDLQDSSSFANRLQDTKYKTLASAYDFGNTISTKTVQTTDQTDNLVITYDQTIANRDQDLAEQTRYFKAVSGTFTQVDDLFKNTQARDYVFKAFDIDPKTFNYDTLRNVITSDTSDPASYVNTEFLPKIDEWTNRVVDLYSQRLDPANSADDKAKIDYLIAQYTKQVAIAEGYFELADAFNFKPDGTLDAGVPAQTATQEDALTDRFVFKQPRLTRTGALLNKTYYETNVPNINSVSELLNDTRLSKMVLLSFGISLLTSKADIESALKQDPADPASPLYRKGNAFIELHNAFNFESDGSITPGKQIQDADQIRNLTSNYIVKYDDEDEASDAAAATKFRTYIRLTKDLNDLMSNAGAAIVVREYALNANGIDPSEVSNYKLKRVLTSDPYDPKSYVNSLKDERFVKLAKAFNFTADGKIGPPRYAQTETEITNISKSYYVAMTKSDTSDGAKKKAEAEVAYYRDKLQTLETVDQLVSDKRLTDFLLVSEGLSSTEVTPQTLRKILTSDLQDPQSFANSQDDIRLKKLAGSFSFNAMGIVEPKTDVGAQNERGLIESSSLFLRQTLEEEAGNDNVGARLALYFQRMAPTITSTYEILADTALAEFVRTAFSIPAETASSDIDIQKALIERQLDLKDLQDPEKLDKMIRRFLALNDVADGSQDPALQIFSGDTTISFDTVATLMQLRGSRY